MKLSGKLLFTVSTIASHMALYARGFNEFFPRKPMLRPAFSDPTYRKLKEAIEAAFVNLGLPFEVAPHGPPG